MAKHEMKDWTPPYVGSAPAPPPEDDQAPRRKRGPVVAVAAAVVAVSAGIATAAGLAFRSAGEVTIVDAAPGVVVASAAPAPSPSPTSRARAVARVAQTAGSSPTSRPTPAYTASPAELAQARARVTKAEKAYRQLEATPGTTRADLLIAQYDIEAARQSLTDLKAGQPSAEHRYLRILRAKAYLAKAEELYRGTFDDAASTSAERKEAVAAVLAWRDRLAEARRN
ncbi:hypothetical protein JIG36_28905 [Actinoplanes sp. LDG1-06]|uniref:Uncharacterized protein n=1 Tax=Paractinoplanes ovalisporus TaxID=2810368 RepID=A0ABS2AIC8_9ACTN|nr:hypothetical protein [Actinoplanes ovalisporus]MBM2619570.1 hypothetical protein [Actinoplanes ovalisporus]